MKSIILSCRQMERLREVLAQGSGSAVGAEAVREDRDQVVRYLLEQAGISLKEASSEAQAHAVAHVVMAKLEGPGWSAKIKELPWNLLSGVRESSLVTGGAGGEGEWRLGWSTPVTLRLMMVANGFWIEQKELRRAVACEAARQDREAPGWRRVMEYLAANLRLLPLRKGDTEEGRILLNELYRDTTPHPQAAADLIPILVESGDELPELESAVLRAAPDLAAPVRTSSGIETIGEYLDR